MLEYLYFIIELLALLTLAVQYKKLEKTQYIYFLPYLLLIVCYEAGSIYNLFNVNGSNEWITNVIITIEFLFYSCFLVNVLNQKLRRRLFTIVAVTFLFTVIDVAFIQGFWKLATIAILLQYIVLITLVCMFFYQLMNQAGEQLTLIRLPNFWVNTGLLFFCLAEFLFFAAFTYMTASKNYHYYLLWYIISNVANLILYSCLSISFLCFSKSRKLFHS
ncbi:hypothetical protein EOD41_05540 [Mucilaginibacter limnophilus]|uniref:Uncharacterized protein n=1 Tax=Mucilaginibacter limnophilus TaxID=1932778 RepID=A0A3S2VNC3_9SPHI|nr:hypothetical protein [Mucilaginibacter limnophilus]RVU01426.1 hypothetical protein EOD41_05540 [Mucilaginibacter limnophilus]